MQRNLVKIGIGHYVSADEVKAILEINTAPVKRMYDKWKKQENFVDLTQKKKLRTVIITPDFIYVSSVSAETLYKRYGVDTEE